MRVEDHVISCGFIDEKRPACTGIPEWQCEIRDHRDIIRVIKYVCTFKIRCTILLSLLSTSGKSTLPCQITSHRPPQRLSSIPNPGSALIVWQSLILLPSRPIAYLLTPYTYHIQALARSLSRIAAICSSVILIFQLLLPSTLRTLTTPPRLRWAAMAGLTSIMRSSDICACALALA